MTAPLKTLKPQWSKAKPVLIHHFHKKSTQVLLLIQSHLSEEYFVKEINRRKDKDQWLLTTLTKSSSMILIIRFSLFSISFAGTQAWQRQCKLISIWIELNWIELIEEEKSLALSIHLSEGLLRGDFRLGILFYRRTSHIFSVDSTLVIGYAWLYHIFPLKYNWHFYVWYCLFSLKSKCLLVAFGVGSQHWLAPSWRWRTCHRPTCQGGTSFLGNWHPCPTSSSDRGYFTLPFGRYSWYAT